MMYGFGDDQPATDTVSVMEELLIEHITDVASCISQSRLPPPLTPTTQCAQAQKVSAGRAKIKVDDFKFALRKDPKKLARVDELLFMAEDIARARGKRDDLAAFADEVSPIARRWNRC